MVEVFQNGGFLIMSVKNLVSNAKRRDLILTETLRSRDMKKFRIFVPPDGALNFCTLSDCHHTIADGSMEATLYDRSQRSLSYREGAGFFFSIQQRKNSLASLFPYWRGSKGFSPLL